MMAFELDWEERFESPALDESRWLPHHLPQWSSRERSAARYRFEGGDLHLRIEADQEPWCPEFDGEVRVSSLQTGCFAGPLGSPLGQHRFNADLVVREQQPGVRLYTPLYGRFEMRARACRDEHAMVAFWTIGYEDEPERSAEICICEIFGRDVSPEQSGIGLGVHPFGDPGIEDDFERVSLPLDAGGFHLYAAEWTPGGVSFSVDGDLVKSVDQSPAYPMQFMLGIYDLPGGRRDPASDPKEFVVDFVRAYRWVASAGTTSAQFGPSPQRTAKKFLPMSAP
jgi:hypothetical protein